ncbi:MAG TPA: LysM peptidoglycan-binding domain-containing protein [bacterium]|nr:LysM peptidoglycan-binding domain-containing protein [bacterium]
MKKLLVIFSIFISVSCAISNGVYHKVKSGETLSGISRLYGIDKDMLAKENFLPIETDEISEGTTLFIPGAANVKTSEKEELVTEEITEIPSEEMDEEEKDIPFHPVWPAVGKIIVPFGGERESRNEGIDIELTEGTEVRVVADGKVLFSAGHGAYGNTVIIMHSEKYITVYSHLHTITAKEGAELKQGDLIGFSGMSGVAPTPRLHFEIREFSKPVNPMNFLPQRK